MNVLICDRCGRAIKRYFQMNLKRTATGENHEFCLCTECKGDLRVWFTEKVWEKQMRRERMLKVISRRESES